MSVCCECCVLLSGRDLCDELITRPEETYRLWCVIVCDLENLVIEETAPNQLRLSLNRRSVTGCICFMPLIVSVTHDC